MDPKQWDEMFTDFESMIDKLRYYTEIAKEYGSADEAPEEEAYEDEEEGEGQGLQVGKDAKMAAIKLALKRKMKE